MSKLHRRFESLEPRFLLSGTGFVNGSLVAVRTQADFSPAAAYSPADIQMQELPLAEVEDRVEECPSPTDTKAVISPSSVEQLWPQESSTDSNIARSDSKDADSKFAPLKTSQQVIESADVATKEIKIVAPNNTKQISNTTRTLADDSISVEKSLNKISVKSPAFVTLSDSKIVVDVSDSIRSLKNTEQRSLSQVEVTEKVVDNREPTATTQDQTDITATDSADRIEEQEPGKDKGLVETNVETIAETDTDEMMDSRKVWLAAAQEPETSEKMDSSNATDYNLDEKLQQQMMSEEDRSATSQSQETVATNAATVSRQISNQTDQSNPIAQVADRVFSEEQPETDGRWAASQTLPPAEGALLLVALGKPLTRLATGDGRADVTNMDCGSSAARTTFDRSRRNRRKTEGAQDRWQRRGDTRNLTWLPPEELPTDISPELMDLATEQAGDLHTPPESVQSRLADEVIFSNLDVTEPQDRSKPFTTWLPKLPTADAWDSYGILAGTAIVTLTGTISVLAADRHRRMHKQPHRVNLPAPAYNGRTLSRV